MRSILGIDTASPQGSVALRIDGAARGMVTLPQGGHSSGLATEVDRLLREAGIGIADLSGIAVSRGPGSFTGLRIGLAWAKGIAVGAGTPLALVSAHEAAAHAAAAHAATPHGGASRPAADTPRRVVTVTPGERGEVEVARWSVVAGEPRPRLEEGPLSIAVLALDVEWPRVAGSPGDAPVVIPANDSIAEILEEEAIEHRPPALLAASVAAVGDSLLASGESSDVSDAAPAYGRAPNARKPAA